MDDFLLNILADPETGEQLFYNTSGKNIYSKAGRTYELSDSIPVLLPHSASSVKADALHKEFKSDFNYIAHYKQDAKTFDYFAEHLTAVTRDEIKRLEQTVASHVPENAAIILDVGCGNGWVAKKFSSSKKVISMDIAITNVAKVMESNKSINNYGVVADVFHLPFRENSIDCIIASEVMEHVSDPKSFLQKLVKVLKPGGKLIVTTPFNEKIEYYLCVHCNKPTPKNAHLHSFNLTNIKHILPEGSKATTFHNKYLLKARAYIILQFLPFSLWKIVDRFANSITGAPTRLMIETVKG